MKTVKKIEQLGRQTWLAGVGVLDAGKNRTVDNIDKLYIDSNAFIADLVAKGEIVEQELNAKFKGKNMIDEKIAALKAKLGMNKESKEIKIEKLSNKVDRLIEAVAVLAQQKEAEKAATKTTAKKTTSTARKAPATKTAATKTSATKTTTTKSTTAKASTAKATTAKTTTRSTRSTTSKTATKAATTKAAAPKASAKPRVRKTPAATPKPAADETEE